jgi:hypothetical protein
LASHRRIPCCRKDPLEFDIGVEVPEHDLRRDGLLERERRMSDEKDRSDERYVDPRLHDIVISPAEQPRRLPNAAIGTPQS